MASIIKDTTNQMWVFSDTLTNNSYNVVFDTLNKFSDAKIKASLSVQNGAITPIFSNTNLGTYFDEGTESSNSISIIPKATNTAGFIAVHNSSSPVTGAASYYTIKTGEGQANTANVVLYTTDGSNAGVNISSIVGTVVDSEPTSGYYLSFTGSGSSKIKTTGWMTAGTTLTAASKTRYFPITKAVTTGDGGDVVVYATDGSNAGVNISGIVGEKAAAEPTSGYYLAFTGSGKAKVTTAGYLPLNESTATGSSVKYFPITKATTTNNGGDVVVYTTDGSNAGVNISNIVGTKGTTEPTSGYYLAFTGSGSSKVNTAGYLPLNEVTTTGSSLKYFQITAAQLAVSKTGGSITPTASLSKSSSVTWSTSDTSGVWLKATGNGSVSNLSIKANVSTAGYIPTGDVATASNLSIAAASTAATETKYITGVTIASGKSFTVTNAGTVTVTNTGTTTITNGASGKITVKANINSDDAATTNKDVVTGGLWNMAYPAFDGGALTASAQAAASSGTTITTTQTSGQDGVTIQTKYLVNRAVVQYNGAVDGWVTVADNTTALAATNNTAYTNSTLYYLTKVTVPKDKKFELVMTADTALDTSSDLTLTNNAFRRIIATNAGTIYARQTTSGKGDVYVRSYNTSTDVQVVKNGTIVTTSVIQNNTTVTSTGTDGLPTAVTRGKATWETGWITSSNISAATFTNAPVGSTSYIDISNTNEAPVLTVQQNDVAGSGYLYINKGYVDNLKISLAKLIPDTLVGNNIEFAPANYILTGYAAFDAAGAQIIGTMQKYDGSYTVL